MKGEDPKEVLDRMAAMAAHKVRPKALVAIFVGNCEACGAQLGEPCQGVDGKPLLESQHNLDIHKERRWQAEKLRVNDLEEYVFLYSHACNMMPNQRNGTS